MHLVLVHGWGFHAGLWKNLNAHLKDFDVICVDLGFVAGGGSGVTEWPDGAVAVGHSLGLLWLLKRKTTSFRALVSVQGFDSFSRHVPKARIEAVRRGLRQNADLTLQNFWGSCGAPGFAPTSDLNIERLDEGLDWLLHWDAGDALKALECPVLALASRDDPIVPAAMSNAIWQGRALAWSETGGHVLPLQRPGWCAAKIVEFANELP